MKNKKLKDFTTINMDTIFADWIYVDLENCVLYNKRNGLAIGYITVLNDRMIINIQEPALCDNDLNDVLMGVSIFNKENVKIINYNEIYLKWAGGYLHLGRWVNPITLTLPRIFAGDDVEEED